MTHDSTGESRQALRAVLSRLQHLARPALDYAHWRTLAADRPSFREMRQLLRERDRPDDAPVELRLRPLGGRPVAIRPLTSDIQVVWDTFVGRYHLPPPALTGSPQLIWDLGANIGLTMAHMACLYPDARIVGVEMAAGNASLCRSNLAPWGNRCELIEAAVWDEDGYVAYAGERGAEWGFRVVPESAGNAKSARAISLNTLLSSPGAGPRVDYLKMDIEGAESRVLRSQTEWAKAILCLKVEVHGPYSVEQCCVDLEELGFSAAVDRRHWASVVGVRPDLDQTISNQNELPR